MIQSKLYSNNIWRQKLWQKSVLKTSVKYTKGNEGPTFIYTPLGT